jgi:arylsulfatase A-like enzyme
VSANHTLTEKTGFARGFDYFKYVNWQGADMINAIVYSWEDIINKANKYFLWVHYIDPHHPYYAKSPWIEQYASENSKQIKRLGKMPPKKITLKIYKNPEKLADIVALYDSEINFLDSYVGKLIERFELDKNTLLIITSDHGEQFMEHGLIGHSNSLHKEELHVPLIVQFPGVSKMQSIERQVSLLDIMPTILQRLNTDQPEQTMGKPLMENGEMFSYIKKTFLNRKAPVNNFAELDSGFSLKAIIDPEWKYIYNYKNESEKLYNIMSDPLEQKNLADKNIEQCVYLKEQLSHWVSQAKTYPPKSQLFELSTEEKEQLKALGYLE